MTTKRHENSGKGAERTRHRPNTTAWVLIAWWKSTDKICPAPFTSATQSSMDHAIETPWAASATSKSISGKLTGARTTVLCAAQSLNLQGPETGTYEGKSASLVRKSPKEMGYSKGSSRILRSWTIAGLKTRSSGR